MMQRIRLANIYSLTALLFLSCNEELPPRSDPQNLLQASIQAYYDGAIDPLFGPYENEVRIYVNITNNYDETLEGLVDLSGELEIVWQGEREYRRTVKLDASKIVAINYDLNSGRLALDPKRTITFVYKWPFDSDEGVSLLTLFPMSRDEKCFKLIFHKGLSLGKGPGGQYVEAARPRQFSEQAISIKGKVKLFKQLATSLAPSITFGFEYETYRKDHCQGYP